ncbi:MAG: chitobiase/beta-hexosaminidase C-terminal domain-containing protein [Peptococcaceae bacterium]
MTVAQREAYEPAEISVSADSGCQLYYTTDGSEPTAENTAINSNTLNLEPTDQDETVTLKVIAIKGDAKSEVVSTTILFRQERQVTLQASREAACYDNDDMITVMSGADNADVWYIIDYLDKQKQGTIGDVAEGTKATEAIRLPFGQYADGGTLVLQAAAVVDGVVASPTARLDLAFAAKNEDAFVVDGISYSLFQEALQAVEQSAGNTLYLQKNVELGSDVLFPDKAITIASTGSGLQYRFQADSVQLQQNVTFCNLQYDISNLYANGHNVTITDDVTAPFAILGHRVFAGCPYAEGAQMITVADLIELTIGGSGNYTVYGSGAVGTSLAGDIRIAVSGIGGKVARAIWGSTVNGTVTLNGTELNDNTQVELGGDSP